MSYGTVTVEDSGQNNPKKEDVPDDLLRLVYEDNKVYYSGTGSLVWFQVITTPFRCGTFKLTIINTTKLQKNPYVVLYEKKEKKMNLVSETAMTYSNGTYILLMNLKYDKTYYIKYFGIDNFQHFIDGNIDKTNMTDAALWIRETDSIYYHFYDAIIDNTVPRYDRVFYLDKGQVPNFIFIFFVMINHKDEINSSTDAKDVISTIGSSVIQELGDFGFFAGIAISLISTEYLNSSITKIKNPNGNISEQLANFVSNHRTGQVRELKTDTVTAISDVGMKISIKEQRIDFIYKNTKVGANSIEAWDSSTKVAEGPKYYSGKFSTDKEILGDNIGLTEEVLIECGFGIN